MAHYAFINSENVVVEVIVGRDETDTTGGINDWETYYASKRPGLICKRTSYNTYYDGETIYDASGEPIGVTQTNSKHRLGKTPFRGKYATIGDIYDAANDVFLAPVVEDAPE
jgi:hypothetical protein